MYTFADIEAMVEEQKRVVTSIDDRVRQRHELIEELRRERRPGLTGELRQKVASVLIGLGKKIDPEAAGSLTGNERAA